MMQAWSRSAGVHGCIAPARLCRVAATMIIISLYIVTARDEDFEGNVHIVSDGSTNNYAGILQVYTQNQWNVVCYQYGNRQTNRGAAAAACRQKGYTTVFDWGTAEKYNKTKYLQDMAITGILCPEVKFALSQDEIFLLRCDYELARVSRQECDGIVAVQCDNTKQHDTAYNGQVSRINDGDRTELLVIRLEGEQLPICTSYLSKNSADSACRQMGFTESVDSTLQSPNNGRSWKIHDLSECDKANTSLPCFTDCIDRSLGYTLVDECDEYQYEVFCKFDKTIDGVYSGGNQFICPFPTASSNVTLDFLTGLSPLLAAIIVGMAILLLCMCCCPLPYYDNANPNQRYYKVLWRKFRRVRRVPVDADQEPGENQGLLEQQRQNGPN